MNWRDDTLSGSCIIKVRKTSGTTYFTKGLLNELGEYIKEQEDINVVYINDTLTSMQQKKLERRWNDIINDNEDRLRNYYLKSAKKDEFSPTEIESDTEMSNLELSPEERQKLLHRNTTRQIRVIDRFGIIL